MLHVQDVFWTSFVRSIYVLCLRGFVINLFGVEFSVAWELLKTFSYISYEEYSVFLSMQTQPAQGK